LEEFLEVGGRFDAFGKELLGALEPFDAS